MLWTLPNPGVGEPWMEPLKHNNIPKMEAIACAVEDHAIRLLGPCKQPGLQRFEVEGAARDYGQTPTPSLVVAQHLNLVFLLCCAGPAEAVPRVRKQTAHRPEVEITDPTIQASAPSGCEQEQDHQQ